MAKAKATKGKRAAKQAATRKPTARRKPATKAKAKAKAMAKARAKPKAKPARRRPAPPSADNARLQTKPGKPSGGLIVQILDDDRPIEALRAYLAKLDGKATEREAQVALGSAQLMLFAIEREHRGGSEVKQLVDLVLSRWDELPEPAGFHAQGFLRNALAAIGEDRERLRRLVALVPADASPELRYNIAAAHAFVGDKPALLAALAEALDAGATPDQIRRDPDFVAFEHDPDVDALLARASAPAIPVDVAPHMRAVRAALDSAIGTLRGLGERPKLEPPASLELVLSTERAGKVQLPNDYRALLTISDGLTLWDNEFFGTKDYRSETPLAKRARAYLAMSASYGRTGIGACVPLANWGQPNDWLLYDPMGTVRGGAPGYVLMIDADELALRDLVHALERLERLVEDVLGTN